MRFRVLLLPILFCMGCKEDDIATPFISGTWIESVDKTDTLVFSNNERFFTLNRGKEVRNGQLLPKYGSGIYLYVLEEDTISVRNTVSSFSGYYKTSIEIEQNRLVIGDFYQKDTLTQQALIFEKL